MTRPRPTKAVPHLLTDVHRAVDVVVVCRKPSDRADDLPTGPGAPRVRWIKACGGSLGAARNTGLAAATGPYIVYLSTLDRLLPGALAAGVEALRDQPSAFVYGTRSSLPAAEVLLQDQDSRHGAKVLAGSKVGFCLRPQDEIDAGVTGWGGGEVLTQLATGVRHQG